MAVHQGSCHCGAVTFCVNLEIEQLTNCDCSICTKKGVVHIRVQDDQFELLSGEKALTLYQWKSNTASHWFCKHCGIPAFGRPRFDPSRYTVNARCLDDYAHIIAHTPVRQFDGKHHPMDQG